MESELSPTAQTQLDEAVAFSTSEATEAAARFERAIRQALARLEMFPESGTIVRGRFRRSLVPGFPWALFHSVEGERLLVARIIHGRRSPGAWPS